MVVSQTFVKDAPEPELTMTEGVSSEGDKI